jgi:hypothetical protein
MRAGIRKARRVGSKRYMRIRWKIKRIIRKQRK